MSSFAFNIRPMAWADLDQVLAIDRMSFSLPWPESAYRYELADNPASLQWVAEAMPLESAQGNITGMIVVWLVLDEAHIATLAVHPNYRERGIAKQLLAIALRESAHKGAQQAMLEVRAGNLAAQNLYHKFGFRSGKPPARYYKDNNEDALLMNLNQLGKPT
jgi:ribosomal-protein-alanine N-acetyltransferase